MNKKLMLMIIILVLFVMLCGCQPTPQEEVVIGKYNTELQVMQAAKEYKRDSDINFHYEYPDHVTDRYTLSEGNMDMLIDADVYMPDIKSIPVAKIKSDPFTQKRADKILDYFIEDGIFVTPRVFTKADYDEWIVEAKKGNLIDGEYVFDEYSQEWLNDLLNRREQAPDEDIMKEITDYSIFQENGLNGRILIDDEVIGSLHINENQLSFFTGRPFLSSSISQYDDMTGKKIEMPQKEIDFTLQQAAAAAQSVFADLGIDGMEVVESDKVYFINDYSQPYEIEYGGYELTFMRGFGGMLPIYSDGYGMGPNDNFDVMPPVRSEVIHIVIDEYGEMAMLVWVNPIKIVETMTKHVDILPLEDILDRLAKSTKHRFSYLDGRQLHHLSLLSVYEIRLGLYYLPLKNNPNEYMYAPCWDFVYKNWHEYTEEQKKEIEEKGGYFMHWDELNDDHFIFSAVDGASVSVYSQEDYQQMTEHMPSATAIPEE